MTAAADQVWAVVIQDADGTTIVSTRYDPADDRDGEATIRRLVTGMTDDQRRRSHTLIHRRGDRMESFLLIDA